MIDAVVWADESPSASQAGGIEFWTQTFADERAEWAARVDAVLDVNARSEENDGFATMVNYAF